MEQLCRFDVAYYPKHKTIILPHHNINGEIVGLFERSFLPIRKQMKDEYPEATHKWLCQFPRAKYVPLLKEGHFAEEDEKKTSWSFPNIQNLYGLHLAKDAIEKTGKAIIFEGAKSVMLAHQYGYPFAVASHTFGANPNHISMLIECGAKEIILAFDRQYETVDEEDRQWKLYEKKTQGLAEKVKAYVNVSRIVDYDDHPLLNYKDAPIDQGAEVFRELFERREMLATDGISQREQERRRRELSQKEALAEIARSIPKASVEEHNAEYDAHCQKWQKEADEAAAERQELQAKADTSAAPLFFRGEPIAWEVVTTKKTKIIEGAFSDDEIECEGKHHFI